MQRNSGGMSIPQEVRWINPPYVPVQFAKITLNYHDAILGKPCPPMALYYRWGGFEDNDISAEVMPLLAAERDQLEKHLSNPDLISPAQAPASLFK